MPYSRPLINNVTVSQFSHVRSDVVSSIYAIVAPSHQRLVFDRDAHMQQRFKTDFQRLALMAAVALLLWTQAHALALFVRHEWMAITFPYPLDYGEGPLLDQAVRLARFENIYRGDLTVPPYTLANYPPLFPLAQAPFVWAFG